MIHRLPYDILDIIYNLLDNNDKFNLIKSYDEIYKMFSYDYMIELNTIMKKNKYNDKDYIVAYKQSIDDLYHHKSYLEYDDVKECKNCNICNYVNYKYDLTGNNGIPLCNECFDKYNYIS